MPSLAEMYRPRSFSEIVGQDMALARLGTIEKTTGFEGQAFWLQGQPGTGKTSIARLIANEMTGGDYTACDELDANALDVATVRGWQRNRLTYRPLPPAKCWVWLINESQRLRDNTRTELLTFLEEERFGKVGVMLFTSMPTQKELFGDATMASALLSRCHVMKLDSGRTYRLEVAKRLREIAQSLHLDGKPEAAYTDLIDSCNGNFREALQKISSGCMMF